MKMNIDQKVICDIPISMVDDILSTIEEKDWFEDEYRAGIPTMAGTNSIPIFHTCLCATAFDDDTSIMDISKRKLYDKYFPVIEPVLALLKNHYEFKQYAALLTRCHPKGFVGGHVDRGNFLTLCHRIHVPIQTNDKAIYKIDNNSYHWEKGKNYEFDNTRMHGVYNGGDDHRIHMIINLYNLDRLATTI